MSGTQWVAGQRITAATLNLNIPGAWQAITPQHGWSNVGAGNVNFQCRKHDSVTVEVIGTLAAGTLTDGTTVGTLPSSMFPAAAQQKEGVVNNPSGVHGQSFLVNVTTAGNMNINGVPGTTTQISLHFFVALDA